MTRPKRTGVTRRQCSSFSFFESGTFAGTTSTATNWLAASTVRTNRTMFTTPIRVAHNHNRYEPPSTVRTHCVIAGSAGTF